MIDTWSEKLNAEQQELLMDYALKFKNKYLIGVAYAINPSFWREYGVDARGCIACRKSSKTCKACLESLFTKRF